MPTGFWACCRAEGPALWQRTRALLAARDTGPVARAATGEAAEAAFAAFAAALLPGDADG